LGNGLGTAPSLVLVGSLVGRWLDKVTEVLVSFGAGLVWGRSMDGVGRVPFALSKEVLLTTYIIAAGFIGLYGIYFFFLLPVLYVHGI
jgi:hypothetical protein